MMEANISSTQTSKTGTPSNTVFILDTYNPHGIDKNSVRYVISINDRQWAIKEVELDWGLPQLVLPIGEREPDLHVFQLYNTLDEAIAAAEYLKILNRDR